MADASVARLKRTASSIDPHERAMSVWYRIAGLAEGRRLTTNG